MTSMVPLPEKIDRLSQKDLSKAVRKFKQRIDSELAAYLHSCVHCGLCADACHYYLTDHEFKSIPAFKLSLVSAVFKKYFSSLDRKFAWLHRARILDKALLSEWIDSLFGRCTLCGRCTINCSVGINITALIRTARGLLASLDLVPPGLQSTVSVAVETGNNMGI